MRLLRSLGWGLLSGLVFGVGIRIYLGKEIFTQQTFIIYLLLIVVAFGCFDIERGMR